MTPFSRRKEAPFHFLARANNAWFAAKLIKRASDSDLADLCEEFGYGGNPRIALSESYEREAGTAIELILKAVICQRIERKELGENGLPKHHDLQRLWSIAKLPALTPVQAFQLEFLAIIVQWMGRYPTPKNEKMYEAHFAELNRLQGKAYPLKKLGALTVRQPRGLDHAILSDMYIIAHSAFLHLRQA